MCRKGAWIELTVRVTGGLEVQSRMHGIKQYKTNLLRRHVPDEKVFCCMLRGKSYRKNAPPGSTCAKEKYAERRPHPAQEMQRGRFAYQKIAIDCSVISAFQEFRLYRESLQVVFEVPHP